MADFGSTSNSDGNDAGGPLDARFIFDDGSGDGDSGVSGSSGNGGSSGDNRGSGSVKRGRGRPKLSDAERAERAEKRRPARAASEASVSASIDGLSRSLLLLHTGIYAGILLRTKNPKLASIFAISPEESRLIAEPAAALMSRYVGKRSPDAQLWVNLAMAIGSTYGGKLAAVMIAGGNDGSQATPA